MKIPRKHVKDTSRRDTKPGNVAAQAVETLPRTKSAFGYVRTATRTGGVGSDCALEKQRKQLESYRTKLKQMEIVLQRIIADEAQRGDSKTRPGLRQILRAAKDRKFDVLIVTSQDRLARGWGALKSVLEKIEAHGAQVFDTCGRRISLQGTHHGLMKMLMASASEHERETIRARRRDKKRTRPLLPAQA